MRRGLSDNCDYSNDDFKDEDFDYSNDDEVLKLTLAVILPMRPDMQVKKDSVGCKRLQRNSYLYLILCT